MFPSQQLNAMEIIDSAITDKSLGGIIVKLGQAR